MHAAVVTPAVVLTAMGWATVQVRFVGEPPLGVSVNVTLPPGLVVPVTAGVMVAVKVINWLTAAVGSDDSSVVVVAVWFTFCESATELLRVKFVSPLYFATTLCVLAEGNVKLHTGTTPPLSVSTHRFVEVVLSTKVTVPLGNAAPAKVGVTTAVKLTCWFTVEEAGEEVREVVVPDAVTTSERDVTVPVPKLASPLYVAVIVVPVDVLVKVYTQVAVELALPTVSPAGGHNCVTPWVNVTLPEGTTVPDVADTVAVKVTDWFTSGEEGTDPNDIVAPVLFTLSVIVGAVAPL